MNEKEKKAELAPTTPPAPAPEPKLEIILFAPDGARFIYKDCIHLEYDVRGFIRFISRDNSSFVTSNLPYGTSLDFVQEKQ